jgi:pimeloyl-ACP methyl ester carboxylesterase
MAEQATVVLVHGAWHGSWCWDPVVRRLDAAGVPVATVDNPSVASANASLHDDGDNVRRVLDSIEGPVVLVGHSYGGAVITDAGSHDAVRQLVYLTAFVIDEGESVTQNDLSGGEEGNLGEALRIDDAGETATFDPDRSVEFFYHDCPSDAADAAADLLRPQSLAAFAGVPRSIAWRQKPAVFVLCRDDRALPVPLQMSMAARVGGATYELAASHSPFLSQPDALADLLIELSRA